MFSSFQRKDIALRKNVKLSCVSQNASRVRNLNLVRLLKEVHIGTCGFFFFF